MESPEPTLDEVKAAIANLRREDRAMLRPWMLARYDARGYRAVGYAAPSPSESVGDAAPRAVPREAE